MIADMPDGLTFHHLGVACGDITRDQAAFAILGYQPEGDAFADPIQGIRGLFLTGPGPRLELVAPLDESSTVLTNLLAQRVKLYHFAYETPAFEQGIAALRASRGKLVSAPAPAIAFGGRRIAFVSLPNRVLIELIEA